MRQVEQGDILKVQGITFPVIVVSALALLPFRVRRRGKAGTFDLRYDILGRTLRLVVGYGQAIHRQIDRALRHSGKLPRDALDRA